MRTFAEPELESVLRRADIAVSVLPDVAATRGLLNSRTLSMLPHGASLVNVGRGSVLDEDALLEWLDADPDASATLDVASQEPLTIASGLWLHPRVTLTPHVAGMVKATRCAPVVVENIRRFGAGEGLLNLVDRSRGY